MIPSLLASFLLVLTAGPPAVPADTTVRADTTARADTTESVAVERDAASEEPAALQEEAAQEADEPQVSVGGAVRFNATYRGYNEADRDRGGDLFFETFIVNAAASYRGLSAAADYRFYNGYHMLKYGYVSYDFSDALTGHLGVHRVPFGVLPYMGNSWFFQLSYYLGFEDDYDAGLKLVYDAAPWNVQAAFYKTEEGSYTGTSAESARYSFDVVPTDIARTTAAGDTRALAGNEEVNQGNLRVAYTLDHGDAGSTTLGASGQVGGLYNATTEEMGHHRAAGVHLNGTYGPLGVKLLAMRYEHRPQNPDSVSVGSTRQAPDERFITMGAFDFPYEVARDANLYQVGLSYTLDVDWGPLTTITFYDDFAYMDKDVPGDDIVDSPQNIAGVMLSTGKLFLFNDLVIAKNEPFAVPGDVYGTALGRGSDEWYTRFNINIGYYF